MPLVTGASGYVGGAALRQLARLGVPAVALARNAEKAARALPDGTLVRIANYEDRSSLERAFEGVTKLLFVASDGAGAEVIRQHANVIDAATTVGVEHVAFTSIVDVEETSPFYYAPVYRDAERRLVESGVGWTILRCGLYADFVLSNWLLPARSSGEVSLPVGWACIAPISRDDVAAAAVAALVSNGHKGRRYDLTGPRSHSFAEVAEVASAVLGLEIRYAPCSPADYLLRSWTGSTEPGSHAFTSLYASIAQGRYGSSSTDVQALIGRPAEDLEAFLRRKLYVASGS